MRLATPEHLPKPDAAGYVDVNRSLRSRMHYVFYESQRKEAAAAPIILWMQGGPGESGLVGDFLEIGPLRACQSGCYRPHFFTDTT